MHYREAQPPPALRHLVKASWTLDAPEARPGRLTHVATPDGCMELIWRLAGRSEWNGEQPARFVAGIITRPAELGLSGGSRFVAVRIWPWTWRALTGRSPAGLTDRWEAMPPGLDRFEDAPRPADAFGLIAPDLLGVRASRVATAVLSARSVREMGEAAGLSPRALQRWFEAHVGMPPRSYLRLLRFSEAFAELPAATSSLAGHAFDHGFADQAHMAREFRSLAGSTAAASRPRARGPFIEDSSN